MTILYNTETNQVIGHYDPYYTVLGKKAGVDEPAVELQVIHTEQPEIEEGYQAVSNFTVDIENKEYRQEWGVVEIPPQPEPETDLSAIVKILTKKVDGETLTEEEESLLSIYKTLQEG